MSYLSIKEYATKNKISIFNVMKMVKSQELKTITKLVDGKEILYIEEMPPNNHQILSTTSSNTQSLQDEVKHLKEEVTKLRAELNRLKVTVFKMAKKDAKVLKI